MPGSSPTGNEAILELIGDLEIDGRDIETILDVGPGRGQWYDLLHPWFPTAEWDAVEIFEPYVERYQLTKRYDHVWVADIRDQITYITDRSHLAHSFHLIWDLVIFGDVLEHMTHGEAKAVVANLLTRYALISIPLGICPQTGTEENPYEEHVSIWYDRYMEDYFPQITRSIVAPQDPLMDKGIGRGIYLLEKT
jgi:hypothetical protein